MKIVKKKKKEKIILKCYQYSFITVTYENNEYFY